MNTALLSLYNYIFLQVGDLIEGIFAAGFWVAIVLVVLIIIVGIWLFNKFRGRNRGRGPGRGSNRI